MKVLFQSRTSLFSAPGGDTVQIKKTKEFLEKNGIKVDISLELEPTLDNYDLVHLFNLMNPQEMYIQFKNAKIQGKKVAISTIYGLYTEFERKARGGISQKLANLISPYALEYIKTILRYYNADNLHAGVRKMMWMGYYRMIKYIVNNADLFLPNSHSEMDRVASEYNLNKGYDYVSIPNAVDTDIFNYDDVEVSEHIKKYEGCVLCAARIEGRKSQLNLIRAMKDLPYELVLIGNPSPNQIKYVNSVKREAGNRVHIISPVDHKELAMYYKVAKVHALISWMETPGLSSLEAAAMKCNLVVTKKGDTEDYFGSYAYYCEPDDLESIKFAIKEAYESKISEELYNKVKENFTWQKTAEYTIEGYKKILNIEL